jgi:hypothetical protein
MTNDTTTGFKMEGQPAFPVLDTATENAAASSAEKTDTTQTQSQGGEQSQASDKAGGENKGAAANPADDFSKHPRWQERENDWKGRFNDQEKRHTDELGKLRTEFESKLAALAPKATDAATGEPPAWFNGDKEQWSQYLKWNEDLVTNKAGALLSEKEKATTQKQQAEQNAIKEATDYFNAEVAALESDKTLNPKGEKIDRNKLLKTAMDLDLVTSDGKWNYKAAFRMMSSQFQPAPTKQDRKELAGATVSGGKAEPATPNVTTSDDFNGPGKRPW